MTNERNVAALTAAIAEVLASPEGWRAMAEPRAMAEGIVTRCSALVPSTLAEREADFLVLGIDHGRNMLPEGPEMGKPIRDVLADRVRRIAVGDAP
jgi:hypothetical protein